MIFFFIFIAIPLIEVALFAGIGGEIGILPTLLLCLLTAMIGGYLVRSQGIDTLLQGRRTLSEGALPIDQIFDGFCLVIAGAMLLTPGFFTDFIGFSLLVPSVRVLVKRYLSQRLDIYAGGVQQPPERSIDPDIVEGEFTRIDDKE